MVVSALVIPMSYDKTPLFAYALKYPKSKIAYWSCTLWVLNRRHSTPWDGSCTPELSVRRIQSPLNEMHLPEFVPKSAYKTVDPLVVRNAWLGSFAASNPVSVVELLCVILVRSEKSYRPQRSALRRISAAVSRSPWTGATPPLDAITLTPAPSVK